MTSSNFVEQVEVLKNEGNKAFASKDYKLAVAKFTEALQIDPASPIFHSNRSAAFASLTCWEEALKDAERAIELKPDWSKGYSRKGAALQGLGRYQEALEAYQEGLNLEPGSVQLMKAMEACEAKLPQDMFSGVLKDPSFMEKIAKNPKTSSYISDPLFMKALDEARRNPALLPSLLQKDQRILECVLVSMGVQMTDSAPTGKASDGSADSEPSAQQTAGSKSEHTDAKAGQSPAGDEERAGLPAEREKELGNAAYKRKDFEAALQHYRNAEQLDPTNPSYLLNQSAVLFEQALFDECIARCEASIVVGREHKADFKQIAKAYLRMATCFHKLGRLDESIRFYNKSLTEHRSPEALEKLRAVEREREQRLKESYHDPAKAEQERSTGNELFKQGRFAEAVRHYSEAIKRDEADPRAYSNRAACYTKLAAVPEGLKDCETAIALDPLFTKAHIRKATLLLLKRDFALALAACDAAEQSDPGHRHAKEISDVRFKARAEQFGAQQSQGQPASEEDVKQRALRNPEVMEILSDPAMQAILQQMQADPRAAMDHMKNPIVAAKIKKLVDSGIVRTA